MNAKTFHMNDHALRSLCESVADCKLSGQPIDELLRLEIDTLSDDQVEKLHQFTEGAMYAGRNLDRWRHEPAEIMPSFYHEAFHFTDAGRARTPDAAKRAYEQEVRRRWRSLVLAVKAKLVAVQDEIATFEQEFLAYAVAADGKTVGEHIIPQLKAGGSVKALPGFGDPR